jgi:hypothetical protein
LLPVQGEGFAREERPNLFLDEAADGVGEWPREEHQPRRAFGERGIEPLLDCQGLEDLVRHRASQVLVHRRIPAQGCDHGDVSIGVGERASNPDAWHREGEEQHGEDEEDRGRDATEAPPLGRTLLELFDSLGQRIAL